MPVRTAQEFEKILPRSQRELLGLEAGHVAALESDCCVPGARMLLHPAVTRALRALCDDARRAGFELRAVSGFRAFQRQLQIWNGKARGERELLDADERPLRASELEPVRIVEALLRWSALPGLSRHHWGSDVDVIDLAAIEPGSVPRLLAADCRGTGCQASLHAWLDARIGKGQAHGVAAGGAPAAASEGGLQIEQGVHHAQAQPEGFGLRGSRGASPVAERQHEDAVPALEPAAAVALAVLERVGEEAVDDLARVLRVRDHRAAQEPA